MTRAPWLACAVLAAGSAAMAQTTGRHDSQEMAFAPAVPMAERTTSEDDVAVEGETPEAPDELVDENEGERRLQNRSPRQMVYADVANVMRSGSTSANGSIRVQIQPYTPQREIRLRSSDARQLVEGANSQLQLLQVRLTTTGSPIRSAGLEFTVGVDEKDGLPAVIRVNQTTSLFNFDYVRLENSKQPLIATLTNAMDPETHRCKGELSLGIGAEDFHDRFLLLGNSFGYCDRIIKSRQGDLVFADVVPQQLRSDLRDLYDEVSKELSSSLGVTPGIVFVIWRPESSRNDVRFVRSLGTTNVLFFNGRSWAQGLTAQQREALWEDVAQEQILRRIPEQVRSDTITQAAIDYLLKLARAERQHATLSLMNTELPEWVAACARAISRRTGTANASRDDFSHECSLVVQFVHDAVTRAKSSGAETVMSTWRTVLASATRRKQSETLSTAFLHSSDGARRIVQRLLNGATDWVALAKDLEEYGVQLRVTIGPLATSVEVQSMANFRD